MTDHNFEVGDWVKVTMGPHAVPLIVCTARDNELEGKALRIVSFGPFGHIYVDETCQALHPDWCTLTEAPAPKTPKQNVIRFLEGMKDLMVETRVTLGAFPETDSGFRFNGDQFIFRYKGERIRSQDLESFGLCPSTIADHITKLKAEMGQDKWDPSIL